MSKLILYDLPSKDPCECWTYNPWKTRLALNFKGIDYDTEWIEYPDVAPKLSGFGIPPPDPPQSPPYTIPAVKFPDGTYLMDSWAIAKELEERYPSPSLHLDYEKLELVKKYTSGVAEKTRAHWVAKVCRNLLPERSAEYFQRTRAERFGMPLDQFEKETATDDQWEDAKISAKGLGDILRETGGPYFMGATPSYADFITASFLHFLKRAGGDELQSKALALDLALPTLFQACQKWFERSD